MRVVVPVGEQRGRHELQDAVLRPGDRHRTLEPGTADDPERFHGRRWYGPPARARPVAPYARRVVNLTRIYTRTGDDGTTSLGDFSRTSKTDPRLVAYADVDEANSAIGVVAGHRRRRAGRRGRRPAAPGAERPVRRRRRPLHARWRADAGAPAAADDAGVRGRPRGRLRPLERASSPLRSFVLPGGTVAAAHLHVARTVARRAERSVWAAVAEHGTSSDGGINPLTAQYLNRLSDLLFILCRQANRRADGWRTCCGPPAAAASPRPPEERAAVGSAALSSAPCRSAVRPIRVAA